MKTEKYRFDNSTGSLYEYDDAADAYLFVGYFEGTESDAIKSHEENFSEFEFE